MPDKKNILIVASKFPPEYSGPGVRIIRLYKHLKNKNYDFSAQVLCNGIEQNKNERYTHEDLKVRRITGEYLNYFFSKIKFIPSRLSHFIIYHYEFLKTFAILILSKNYTNTDFIHIFGHSGGTAATLLWAKLKNIPVLLELVTEKALPQQKIFFLVKISPPNHSKVIALTEHTKKRTVSVGYPEHNIWCRPNPIDENLFKIDIGNKFQYRKKISPFHEDDIIILSIAKLMPQKNQKIIIEILKYLPPEYKAIIAGPFIKEGTLYQRDLQYINDIKKEIQAHDLQSRVHLHLNFVESHAYMKASDIYLLPAWNEGFGTPMMEALACGLPVIANKEEYAFQEWIKPHHNGYLCDISAPKEWANSIEMAYKFSNRQRIDFSYQIQEKAGQKTINVQYEKIIHKLSNIQKQ